MKKKKAGFLDPKRNLIGLSILVVLVVVGGLYIGRDWGLMKIAAQKLATSHRPDLPVTVSYRDSLVGKGYVAVFKNTSRNTLEITVDLQDSKSDNKKRDTIDLKSNQTKEIGWAEGWQFYAGDIIRLSHPEFEDALYKIDPQ